MKRLSTLLFLLAMFTVRGLAQEPSITGVYSGQTNCWGRANDPISIAIVHMPDNSLFITLVGESVGRNSSSRTMSVNGAFRALTEKITLTSPKWRQSLNLDVSNYKKQVRLEFAGVCEPFYLRRNAEESKELVSILKGDSKAKKNSKNSAADVDLSPVYGFWVMDADQQEEYQIIGEKDGVYLRKLRSAGYLVRLELENLDLKAEGGPTYLFRPASDSIGRLDFVKVAMRPDAMLRRTLNVSFRHVTGQWSSTFRLRSPIVPSQEIRAYGGETFIYGDWQKKKYEGYHLVNDEEAVLRLKETIDKLYVDGGWRCLAQTGLTVTTVEDNSRTFEEQGVDRLYLIYSPYGSGLIYRTPTGKLYPTEYSYPLFVTSHPTLFATNARFAFQVLPFTDLPALSFQQIPVTIFHFGRSPGDYGTGCQYTAEKERSDNFRNRVLAKLVIVFALEYGRRVSVESKAEIPRLATTVARDEFVKSLIHDLMPEKTDDELNYLTRWIGLVMSGDFRPQSYVRESIREAIIQRVANEKPQYAMELRMLDLLIDLAIERRRW